MASRKRSPRSSGLGASGGLYPRCWKTWKTGWSCPRSSCRSQNPVLVGRLTFRRPTRQRRPPIHGGTAGRRPDRKPNPTKTAGPAGYIPQQLQQAYGVNLISYGSSIPGTGAGKRSRSLTGTTIFVPADDLGHLQGSALQVFDQHLAWPIRPVSRSSGRTATSGGPAQTWAPALEIALDIEWAHSIAPAGHHRFDRSRLQQLRGPGRGREYRRRSLPRVGGLDEFRGRVRIGRIWFLRAISG